MINISICDDSEQDIEALKAELRKYEIKKQTRFNVSSFSNQELLIYELQEGNIADIYILDVSMPGKDGFELAEEIRSFSETTVIIFLTSLENSAVKGYKARALRYIVKLNLSNEIEEALESAIKEISKLDCKAVTLQRYNDYWRVPYRDIIYVRRISRQLVIMTNSHGELTYNRAITEFYNTLDDNRFLFVDRSCFQEEPCPSLCHL